MSETIKIFDMNDYKTKDYDNPKALSIQFINSAYELLDCVKKNPYDFDGARRYISHGYYLEVLKCKKATAKKTCNLILCKRGVSKLQRTRAHTFQDSDIAIGITKLLTSYIRCLINDNSI